VRLDHGKKSDGVIVYHKKERYGECTIRKSNGVRVHHKEKSDGVRAYY